MNVWLAGLVLLASAAWAGQGAVKPRVRLETNRGSIVIELEPSKAPKTVANFLGYVRSGFYDGTIFHRVIAGFMVQGGGFTADYMRKPTGAPVENEAANGLSNRRGSVAMARTSEVDSATSQFFINLVDNTRLDHFDDTPRGFGYCVFGQVVEGMDVVDAIAVMPTGAAGPFASDVPTQPVVITRAVVVE